MKKYFISLDGQRLVKVEGATVTEFLPFEDREPVAVVDEQPTKLATLKKPKKDKPAEEKDDSGFKLDMDHTDNLALVQEYGAKTVRAVMVLRNDGKDAQEIMDSRAYGTKNLMLSDVEKIMDMYVQS